MDIRVDGISGENKARQGRLKGALVAAGLILAAVLIWRLGPAGIGRLILAGHWRVFVLVVGAYVLQQTFGTAALWLLGTVQGGPGWRSTGLGRLARVRYIGEVLNYSMPTGGIGGEPYKLVALSGAEGKNPAFRALAAAKFLHVAAVGPFSAAVFLGAARAGIGGRLWQTTFVYLGAVMLVATAFLWAIVFFSFFGRMLLGAFFRIRHRVPAALRGLRRFLHIDLAASHLIRKAPLRTAAAYVLYGGMWLSASLEWLAISRVLGLDIDLTGAGLFECATIIVAALLPVPAGMGTQEAGKAALTTLLGMPPGAGVAMSLVRRGREAMMVAFGALVGLVEWRRSP